ncbi:MAG TPA: F0F1 ATP synthase subunit C [Acidiferrobacter sp.]|nr:F0F1 ATP synthase subunit C [Acidiferrobacter sp.]
MSPEMITMIYSYTAIGIGVMLGAAGLGSAIGWGLICAKTQEGITRQPELKPMLMTNMFIFAGLMESFPFIMIAFAMWFLFANPILGSASAAIMVNHGAAIAAHASVAHGIH